MPIKNVAIYARVSTLWQAEKGYSIPTQVEACIARVHEIGAQTIKQYIDDGYSGAYLERPALDELRQALKAKVYDAVICYDPDRLSRNLSHQLIISDDIDRSGAELIFVSVQFEQSPEGRLFYAIRGAVSGYEREKIRERTMRGKRGKLQAGKIITDSHVYGYDFDKETSQYIINEYETNVIKKIYNWYIVEKIGGGDAIAARLSANSIPSPTGKSQWSSTTVRSILKRQMYTGSFFAQTYYHKKIGQNKEARIPRDKDEWILMIAPAIISKEQHKEACELMTRKRTYKTWTKRSDVYLLQGILSCGNCGKQMSIVTTKKVNKYYACITRMPNASSVPCGSRYVRTSITDEIFWKTLVDICKSTTSLSKYISSEIKPAETNDIPSEKIEKDLIKTQKEQEAIMNWFGQSLISQEIATKKLKTLKDKETDLKKRLERLSTAKPSVNVEKICSMVKNCPNTIEARRNMIITIIDNVSLLRTDNNYGGNYELNLKIKLK